MKILEEKNGVVFTLHDMIPFTNHSWTFVPLIRGDPFQYGYINNAISICHILIKSVLYFSLIFTINSYVRDTRSALSLIISLQ